MGKHLTAQQRGQIELMLKENYSASRIAALLDVSKSTVCREISLHTKFIKAVVCDCANFKSCRLKDLCEYCPTGRQCKNCRKAHSVCHRFVHEDCKKKNRVGVCNHCPTYSKCNREKGKYKAEIAQKEYSTMLTNCRKGFATPPDDLQRINDILAPLIKKGQSIYCIMQTHGEELNISESTLRRMIDSTKLPDIRNIDLPRQVRYKKRNYNYKHAAEVKAQKIGHTKEDFDEFIACFPDIQVVEMDTVVSVKNTTAALLTLIFNETTLQIAHFMENNTARNVLRFFDNVEAALGTEIFSELFPVILTDNGTEFDEFLKIERSIYGGTRTKVFFCSAYRSNDKPHCENNHAMIRRIIPKGTDFTDITQPEIDLMMNHINNYKRKKYDGVSPMEYTLSFWDVRAIEYFHLEYILADDVILKPNLLSDFYNRTGQTHKTLGELAGLD